MELTEVLREGLDLALSETLVAVLLHISNLLNGLFLNLNGVLVLLFNFTAKVFDQFSRSTAVTGAGRASSRLLSLRLSLSFGDDLLGLFAHLRLLFVTMGLRVASRLLALFLCSKSRDRLGSTRSSRGGTSSGSLFGALSTATARRGSSRGGRSRRTNTESLELTTDGLSSELVLGVGRPKSGLNLGFHALLVIRRY